MSPIETGREIRPTEEGEDWRQLTDAHERRRVQNRIAQRNYRRNIKRRLQQLETFTQGVSVDTQTSKQQPPQPSQMACQVSVQPEEGCLHTITPAASDTLLSDINTTPVSAAESADTSIEAALFSSKEDTERRTSLPDQEDCDIALRREHDRTATFYSTAPLMDLENDVAFFSRPIVPLLQTSLSSPSTASQNLNALQKAVIKGRYNIAKLLVENGSDVYAVDDYGNNILHLAAQFGHASLVSFALSHCPNINDINLAGDTPLHVAIEHDYPEIVQILIRAGADMEFKSY